MEWTLNSIKKWLATPIISVPLLHQYILQAGLCCRLWVCSWVMLTVAFLLSQSAKCHSVSWTLLSEGEASGNHWSKLNIDINKYIQMKYFKSYRQITEWDWLWKCKMHDGVKPNNIIYNSSLLSEKIWIANTNLVSVTYQISFSAIHVYSPAFFSCS